MSLIIPILNVKETADVEPKKIMNLWTLTFINQDLEEKYSNKEK